MAQRLYEDLVITWLDIIVDLVFAMLFCLIVIAMMRWVVKLLVWLSIAGVIAVLAFGRFIMSMDTCKNNFYNYDKIRLIFLRLGAEYSFKNYIYFQNDLSTDANSTITLISLLDDWLQKSNTWLWFGIVAAILLFILLIVLSVIRKRIAIAIAIVVEGSK